MKWLSPTSLLALAVIGFTVSGFTAGWTVRSQWGQRERARDEIAYMQALADAVRNARAIEQTLTARMAEIGAEHEQEQRAAVAVEAAVLADLRAGAVQLRREWGRCETARVSGVAATTAERDAARAERDALAAAVVRVGHDADRQLAACQAVIRAYHQQDSASASTLTPGPSPINGRGEQRQGR